MLDATKCGDAEEVGNILDQGINPNIKDETGTTPLHLAAQEGHDGIVQILVKFLAQPNAKNCYGSTPLHEAAKQQNPNCVRLLLKDGADPKITDDSGSIPLHYADNDEIVRLLLGMGQPAEQDVESKVVSFC